MTDRKPRKPPTKHSVQAHRKSYWMYGFHCVRAALQNPIRHCERLVATRVALTGLGELPETSPTPELTESAALATFLPAGAIHQGLALRIKPLLTPELEEILPDTASDSDRPIVVLDQVTDPRNVGAILRCSAAFDTKAVVVPDRHAPSESGVMAKAASGALEFVPMIRVSNLSRALKQIAGRGYWCVGLDQNGQRPFTAAFVGNPAAIVLGGEGKGLRRLTQEQCDELLRIPITSAIPSLNVATSAAIALYELSQARKIPEKNQ
ncbi:MAG: 23S rRNA (guanosine(2251)-2'-O)-methyltransferase RlmB [Pseudomonadales bacterium]|nr:23S rRNA (guanosine(2251)-2'-O)-methyltransferase RlmB [Pseudomonadales bacterium]